MNPIEAYKKIGATHYLTMLDNETPQMYYRIKNIKYNDGTNSDILEYYSSFNIWQPSFNRNQDKLKSKLKRIIIIW